MIPIIRVAGPRANGIALSRMGPMGPIGPIGLQAHPRNGMPPVPEKGGQALLSYARGAVGLPIPNPAFGAGLPTPPPPPLPLTHGDCPRSHPKTPMPLSPYHPYRVNTDGGRINLLFRRVGRSAWGPTLLSAPPARKMCLSRYPPAYRQLFWNRSFPGELFAHPPKIWDRGLKAPRLDRGTSHPLTAAGAIDGLPQQCLF